MVNSVAYIDDTAIDLFPGTVIALTIQKIEIGSLSTRNVNFTNTFKVPRTRTNEILFTSAGNENVSSTAPYSIFNCKLVQNGTETIPDGRCVLVGSNDKEYSIQILENLVDVFSSITGKKLNEMELLTSSGWLAADIDTARTATEGIVSAVLNWGKNSAYTIKGTTNCAANPNYPVAILGDAYTVSVGGRIGGASGKLVDAGDVYIALAANAGGTEAAVGTSWFVLRQAIYNADFFLPSFYYHSIVKSILQSTGLSLSGSILTDARFTDLVIPYCAPKFEYPSSQSQYNSKVSLSALTGEACGSPMPFNTVDYDSSSSMTVLGTSYQYTSKVNGSISISVPINVSLTWSTATGFTIELIRYRAGVETVLTSASATDPPDSSIVATLAYSGDVLVDDVFYTKTYDNDANNTTLVYLATGNSFSVTHTTTVSTTNVNWSLLLSDIKATDVLSDFFTRYGIIPKKANGVLVLKTIEEICADTINAVDWSAKKQSRKQDSTTYDSGYAQSNKFKHSNADKVSEESLGQGSIEVANPVLDASKTIYTSVFQNARTGAVGSYTVSTIPVYDVNSAAITAFAEEPGLRLMTLKSRVAEPSIKFNTTARTDYKLAYFVDSSKTKDTGFQYFLTQHYPSFSRALQQSKVIPRYFNLTEQDIANYDPHLMIWDGDGYYIVNKIVNYVPGKITKVELFKIL
jgi:hypothetical protein